MKIYLHGENNSELQAIEIADNAHVEEIIIKHHEVFNTSGHKVEDETEYLIFVENDDSHKHRDRSCNDIGIKHHSHVHCHRCQEVEVTLEYNTQEVKVSVPPSATMQMILQKSASELKILPDDFGDLRFQLANGTDIDQKVHIGSFVSYPDCQAKVLVKSITKIEG
ncbi:MAG: hypothetical protein P4L41_02905 [Flavipsychrobacter sp.]|nr:hypothetical protein [Flavipsychrobacter sp.]